jgi:hypothetical protein
VAVTPMHQRVLAEHVLDRPPECLTHRPGGSFAD